MEALEDIGIPAGVLGKWVTPSKRCKDMDADKLSGLRKALLKGVAELVTGLNFSISSQLRGSIIPESRGLQAGDV